MHNRFAAVIKIRNVDESNCILFTFSQGLGCKADMNLGNGELRYASMQYKTIDNKEQKSSFDPDYDQQNLSTLPVIAGMKDAESQPLRIDLPEVLLQKLRAAC